MNLLLLEDGEIGADGRVRLDDRRAAHLLGVLRVEPGRELRAGILGGRLGTAQVVATGKGTVELEVELSADPPPPSGIALAVALPRPQALHRLLQTAAAMAVERLDLIRTWRVEKSYFDSPSLAPDAMRRHLLLGAEQGMTTRLPELGVHRRLLPFLDGLGAPTDGEARLLAHPGGPPLEAVFGDGSRRSVVAVGPEGGLLDREVATFGEHGFVPFGLGPWVLRVESAVVAALAQLALLGRRSGAACYAPGPFSGPSSDPLSGRDET